MKNLESITFDKDDKTLFAISDLQLKADAIRYSILPKLEIIANELVARIIEIYKVDYFEHSSFGKSPHFRKSNRRNLRQIMIVRPFLLQAKENGRSGLALNGKVKNRQTLFLFK